MLVVEYRKIIIWTIVMCLFVIPLDIQLAPSPLPVGGHVVVEVVDAFTHSRIPDATVAVWYDNTRYFAGYCVRTDNDLLVTESVYYWYDELVLVVWHEDYYLSTFQYTVPNVINDPYNIEMEYVFLTSIELFRKSTNTTDDVLGDYPIVVPFGEKTDLMLTCTLQEDNTVFGMDYNWVNPNTDYEYSEGVVVVSSSRTMVALSDYAWQIVNRFYYAFEIGRLYNDANAEDDGTLAIQIPIILFPDCEIGVSVVDTVRLSSEGGLFYYHNVSTFVYYVNETLDCIGEVSVEYGYQPSYIYPSGYIAIEDLRIIWDISENTGGRPWPDFVWVDLYTAVVLTVCAAFVIYVAYWSRKNTVDTVVHLHYLLNTLLLELQ